MKRPAKHPGKYRIDNDICYIEVYTKNGTVKTEALIDSDDINKIKDLRFHGTKKTSIYIRDNNGRYLHNLIIGIPPKGYEVDHKNRNPLDNRKLNLRFASRQQQRMNSSKQKRKLSSKYKGVHWDKNRNQWKAEIKINSINRYIGRFNDEKEAARAYNNEAEKLFGEFAAKNKCK